MLELKRPLVFLDLETTGLDRETDRIVQIALHKVQTLDHYPVTHGPGATHLSLYVDPQRVIPAESIAIHGITNQVLVENNARPFREVAPQVLAFLSGCDVAGFGSNYYDVPLLYNEFRRAGIDWEAGSFQMIDVGNLFKIKEPRGLTAAVRYYCFRDHTDAHSASGDALATADVFVAQLARYPDLPVTVDEMAVYTNHGRRVADISGKFYYDGQGVIRFGFGKYKDQPALEYPDFLDWMWRTAFAPDTAAIVADLLGRYQDMDPDDDECDQLFGQED